MNRDAYKRFPLDTSDLRRSQVFRMAPTQAHCGMPPMVRFINGCESPEEALACRINGQTGTADDWAMVGACLKVCRPEECNTAAQEPTDVDQVEVGETPAFDRLLSFSRCQFDQLDH